MAETNFNKLELFTSLKCLTEQEIAAYKLNWHITAYFWIIKTFAKSTMRFPVSKITARFTSSAHWHCSLICQSDQIYLICTFLAPNKYPFGIKMYLYWHQIRYIYIKRIWEAHLMCYIPLEILLGRTNLFFLYQIWSHSEVAAASTVLSAATECWRSSFTRGYNEIMKPCRNKLRLRNQQNAI